MYSTSIHWGLPSSFCMEFIWLSNKSGFRSLLSLSDLVQRLYYAFYFHCLSFALIPHPRCTNWYNFVLSSPGIYMYISTNTTYYFFIFTTTKTSTFYHSNCFFLFVHIRWAGHNKYYRHVYVDKLNKIIDIVKVQLNNLLRKSIILDTSITILGNVVA